MHPIYRFLTDKKNPKLGGAVKWNFQKYLVNHEGKVLAKFSPRDRVVAPVFELPQAGDENTVGVTRADVADYPAHRLSPPCRLAGACFAACGNS